VLTGWEVDDLRTRLYRCVVRLGSHALECCCEAAPATTFARKDNIGLICIYRLTRNLVLRAGAILLPEWSTVSGTARHWVQLTMVRNLCACAVNGSRDNRDCSQAVYAWPVAQKKNKEGDGRGRCVEGDRG
jgi:hypothetical protein